MTSYHAEFLPPSMADFQSNQAGLAKKEQDGTESIYLMHGGRTLLAEGISAAFKAAVIARSASRQKTVPALCAATVPMFDHNLKLFRMKSDPLIVSGPRLME